MFTPSPPPDDPILTIDGNLSQLSQLTCCPKTRATGDYFILRIKDLEPSEQSILQQWLLTDDDSTKSKENISDTSGKTLSKLAEKLTETFGTKLQKKSFTPTDYQYLIITTKSISEWKYKKINHETIVLYQHLHDLATTALSRIKLQISDYAISHSYLHNDLNTSVNINNRNYACPQRARGIYNALEQYKENFKSIKSRALQNMQPTYRRGATSIEMTIAEYTCQITCLEAIKSIIETPRNTLNRLALLFQDTSQSDALINRIKSTIEDFDAHIDMTRNSREAITPELYSRPFRS